VFARVDAAGTPVEPYGRWEEEEEEEEEERGLINDREYPILYLILILEQEQEQEQEERAFIKSRIAWGMRVFVLQACQGT